MDAKERAQQLLKEFKGDDYAFGFGVVDTAAEFAVSLGRRVLVVANRSKWLQPTVDAVIEGLQKHGVELAGGRVWPGAKPNTPISDVYRLETYILHFEPDCLVAVGAGSTIDAVKAANVLACLGTEDPHIDGYFGTGLVSEKLASSGKRLLPFVAVQTAASSGAHLTKYSNVTDIDAGQKKLIVDEAIVPDRAVFDYGVTQSTPPELTVDGALDALSHCLEVFYGASEADFDRLRSVTETALELVVRYTRRALADPWDRSAREALGLAADLGGLAIMIGGTNGGHLTSFSLTDIATHGRACGVMNPYYTVFFAPAIEKQLHAIGGVLQKAGLVCPVDDLKGRELGETVAQGFVDFANSLGSPTTLRDLPGFSDEHIKRAVEAAKNPQLEMKLKNMPVPLHADLVEEYMQPILEAAAEGDFSRIRSME